jgi:hypothetical protein
VEDRRVSKHLDRARRYHAGIQQILLRDWDPIGVSDVPEAQDEYDSYISKIYGMLIRHEPRHRLVEHLWLIETEYMGLFGNRQRTEATVDRLLSFRDGVEAGA